MPRMCPKDCPCNCHSLSRDVQLIPPTLRQWLGQLHIPRMLVASLWPSLRQCNYHHCARSWRRVQVVKYYAPIWFAHIEASIRFEALPIQFVIQTPRVVPSLRTLGHMTFRELQTGLSTRQITLHDVDENGCTVLHVRRKFLRGGLSANTIYSDSWTESSS